MLKGQKDSGYSDQQEQDLLRAHPEEATDLVAAIQPPVVPSWPHCTGAETDFLVVCFFPLGH